MGAGYCTTKLFHLLPLMQIKCTVYIGCTLEMHNAIPGKDRTLEYIKVFFLRFHPQTENISRYQKYYTRELVSMNCYNTWSIQREIGGSKCEVITDSANELHLKPCIALNSGKSCHCSCLPFLEVYNRTTYD